MSEMQHSDLGFSAAPQWAHCPASPSMQSGFPDDDSEATREGTASHWIAQMMLSLQGAPDIGDTAVNGVIINYEMYSGAMLYVSEILDTAKERGIAPGSPLFKVEERVYARQIHPDVWGTPDTWFYDRTNDDLFVYDYKFGHGFVGAFENEQLIAASAAVLELLRSLNIETARTTVHMCIVQPRNYDSLGPVRYWVQTTQQLQQYVTKLRQAALAARGANPKCSAGFHCRYCKANTSCDAFRESGLTIIDYVAEAVVNHETPAQIGAQLAAFDRAEKLLKYRKEALEAQAINHIKSGHYVPGYSMATTKGHLAWTRPYDDVAALGDALGVELRKKELITPTQAKKKIPETLLKSVADYPDRGLRLVRDDNKTAQHVFSQPAKDFQPW